MCSWIKKGKQWWNRMKLQLEDLLTIITADKHTCNSNEAKRMEKIILEPCIFVMLWKNAITLLWIVTLIAVKDD